MVFAGRFKQALAIAAVAVAAGGAGAYALSAGAAQPSKTRLVVVYKPHGAYPKPGQSTRSHRWTLSCDPARGSHPLPATACRELAAHRSDLLHPGAQCMVIVRGAPSATVSGTVEGHKVTFSSSTCSRAWTTLHALLTGSR
jgi:hypothetical protein